MITTENLVVDTISDTLPGLISSLGTNNFNNNLLRLMQGVCGAEHATVYLISPTVVKSLFCGTVHGSSGLSMLSTYIHEEMWRLDPTYEQAAKEVGRRGEAIVRTDIAHLTDERLRNNYHRANVRDRILIGRRSGQSILGLTLCSSSADFYETVNLTYANAISGVVLALVDKHCEVLRKEQSLSVNLTNLDEIERCIAHQMPDMPRREAEVCSRALYGMCMEGVALDLGISLATAMTYRRRAFARLAISTQRELILWYLDLRRRWCEQADLAVLIS